MPIRNMTDGSNRNAGKFDRIGKLRKGGPMRPNPNKPGKFIMGEELTHFRFTTDDPEIMAIFREVYGDKPETIRAILPFATTDECFSTWREAWVAGGLEHRCDGENKLLWRMDNGHMSHDPVPCDLTTCKPVGRLMVVIPELLARGYAGYVTVETHSINDLVNISAGLRGAEIMVRDRTLGLRGVFVIIRRAKAPISTPGQNGKRATREKWLVSVTIDAAWLQAQFQKALDEHMRPAGLLTTGDGQKIDPATGEIMAGIDAHLDDPFTADDDENGDDSADDAEYTENAVPVSDRPWGRDRVLALLRDYVQQAGTAGEIPPGDEDKRIAKKCIQGILGIEGARKFLAIAFRKTGADWPGVSQAQCDAITKIWFKVDRNGDIGVDNATSLAEAQAVIGVNANGGSGK
jgi:hypothetical protein